MAGTESEVMPFEEIYDMGTGLHIGKVQLDRVKEQDINARIMQDSMQDLLTKNITKRGQLESLPLLVLKEGKLEIISGHHRVKSARAAGLKEIIAIIDVSGLSRSSIAAKQLAHNAISGFDDESTLRTICKMITDVDDMIESAMPDKYFKEMQVEIDKIANPSFDFDMKVICFSFLPHQVKDLNDLVKAVGHADIVGVAPRDEFQPFIKALSDTMKYEDVKSIGMAVHMMTQNTLEAIGERNYTEDEEWTALATLFSGGAINLRDTLIVKKAISKAKDEGLITEKSKSKLIVHLCEQYIGE